MKFSVLATFILIGLFTIAPMTVRADVLMLNLNGATQEIEALRRLTAKNNERLFVLPEGQGDGTYDNGDLAQDLARLARQGVRPRALVASGHHFQDQYFYGSNGKFFLNKISTQFEDSQAAREVRELLGSIQSIYLWGCYTGTLANTELLVTKANSSSFINAGYIVGFLKKGPLGVTLESGRLLQRALEKESQIRQSAESARPALLKSVLGNSRYDLIVHQGDSYTTISQTSSRSNYQRTCLSPDTLERFGRNNATLYSYYNGNLPIPEDTSSGPLRAVYEDLQEHRYCLDKNNVCAATPDGKQYDRIAPETAIRLIFYKKVMKNFSKVYADRLRYLHEGVLIPYGFKNSDFLIKLDSMDRKEIIRRLALLNEENHDLNFNENDAEMAKRYYFVRTALEDIKKAVYTSDAVIPASWTSDDATSMGRFPTLNKFQATMNRAVELAVCLVRGCNEDLSTLIPDRSPKPAAKHCVVSPAI